MSHGGIHVDTDAIAALLLGGDWVQVRDVAVSFADFTRHTDTGSHTWAVGMYLSATIRTGPQSGQQVVARLADVAAIRLEA
jgi:hypothetical protein